MLSKTIGRKCLAHPRTSQILSLGELSVFLTLQTNVATSHCFWEKDWARRSDVNDCDGAQTAFNTDYFSSSHVRMWNRHNSQFSALLTLSDYQNRWSVESNWIVNARVASRLYIFPLFLCVRRGMNYEQFSQVPFDPTLMRPFNKSLRFSSLLLCGNISASFFRLGTYLRCIHWFFLAGGGREQHLQPRFLIRLFAWGAYA